MTKHKMEPIQLTEEPRRLKMDEAEPDTNYNPIMTNQHELMNSIMEMIEAKPFTTKTKAENQVKPLQLSKEPRELKLDEADTKTDKKTSKRMVPPLGTTEGTELQSVANHMKRVRVKFVRAWVKFQIEHTFFM